MLDSFQVSHRTDGKTRCNIYVDSKSKIASVTITINDIIVKKDDNYQNNPTIHAYAGNSWHNTGFWEAEAAKLAKLYSPFWKGETYA